MTASSILPVSIESFRLCIPQSSLDDLQTRLCLTRWPDAEPVTGWSQGVPLAAIQELCKYWQTQYDWRCCEALLNTYPQFTTAIDGVEIYFLHIRSKHEDALPLLITHGWPGSVLEFRHVIAKLVDPEAHGGEAADAFHQQNTCPAQKLVTLVYRMIRNDHDNVACVNNKMILYQTPAFYTLESHCNSFTLKVDSM